MNTLKASLYTLALAGITLFSASCKKEDEKKVAAEQQKAQSQKEDDDDIKTENDQLNDEMDNAVGSIDFGRIDAAAISGCGFMVDESRRGQKILVFNFDGETPCGNPSRTRSGKIELQLVSGSKWSDAGARLAVRFQNYKIKILRSGREATFNGIKYRHNVSGGNWFTAAFLNQLVEHRETADGINVVFGGGATATYSVRRKMKIYKDNSKADKRLTLEVTGDTTINNIAAVDNWGTNRFNEAFTNAFELPFKGNATCWFWRPTQGTIVSRGGNGNMIKITYGVNEQGQADTRDCAYGWKLNWSINQNTGEKVFSY